MKQYTIYNKMLVAFLILVASGSHAQQQFTHTASKENNSCNYDCTIFDVPELNNNAAAIIFATSVLEKGVNLNPHPIGVYYFKNKWHIFNLDGKAIPDGSKFSAEYFIKPDQTHFQYSFTRADIQQDGSALIDHPALNNNPTAKFTSFLSWNPDSQGATTNREEITIQYKAAAGKWSVSNNNRKPLFARATYNIAITSAGIVNTKPGGNNVIQINELIIPVTTTPVFGDISGMYMTVWADGIKLPGDNQITSRFDQMEIIGLEMGAEKLSGPKNVHNPLTIKIRSGYPGTVPLLNAFIKKSGMAFTIDAITPGGGISGTGQTAITYTIKLTGAYILNYKQVFGGDDMQSLNNTNMKLKAYDEIKVKFTKIEFTNSAGATAVDNL